MDRKYMLAIKAGIFCGLAPGLVYGVYLWAKYAEFSGPGMITTITLWGILFFLAPLVAGTLAVKNARPYLHSMKDVMLISAAAGAVEGIVVFLVMAIAQLAAQYFLGPNLGFAVGAMPWGIPILVAMYAIFMAVFAVIAGTIYALARAEVKFKG